MRLAVELYGSKVGTLSGESSRTFDFTPSEEGLQRFGVNSTTLSVAIPLSPTLRRDQAGRRRNWFAELLPEGDQYEYMLMQSALRAGDTLGFLARYGRDVAGALQIWDLDNPSEPPVPALQALSARQIRELLENPMRAPLANDPIAGKSSLGGVQPKVVLVRTERGWAQGLGGYPTTHILKPQLRGASESVIFDEEYGSRLARRLGLSAFATTIEEFDGARALAIERFDRSAGERVHQEDFSQVLGAAQNQKYQRMGGVVSLGRIAQVLQQYTSRTELDKLARMLVLAVGSGNLDMHTKNIGLLHKVDGEVELAPAYDAVPQAHMTNDGELALSVNRKYRHADITREDLVDECASWGLRSARQIVEETLVELSEAINEHTPLVGAFPGLQEQLARFVGNLSEGVPVGSPLRSA